MKTVEVQSDGLENWLLETQTEKELAIDSPGDKADTPQRGENSAWLRSFPVSGFFTGLFPLNNFSQCFTLLGELSRQLYRLFPAFVDSLLPLRRCLFSV